MSLAGGNTPSIRRAFLIGVASGLRTFTGVAAVSWATRYGRLDLKNTKLAFLGHWLTPYLGTAVALGEFVGDTLPITPSRTIPPQFAARVTAGAFCGSAIGLAAGDLSSGLIAGAIGSVVGTVGGLQVRTAMARWFGIDLPAALIEDAAAVAIATYALSGRAVRLHGPPETTASLTTPPAP